MWTCHAATTLSKFHTVKDVVLVNDSSKWASSAVCQIKNDPIYLVSNNGNCEFHFSSQNLTMDTAHTKVVVLGRGSLSWNIYFECVSVVCCEVNSIGDTHETALSVQEWTFSTGNESHIGYAVKIVFRRRNAGWSYMLACLRPWATAELLSDVHFVLCVVRFLLDKLLFLLSLLSVLNLAIKK